MSLLESLLKTPTKAENEIFPPASSLPSLLSPRPESGALRRPASPEAGAQSLSTTRSVDRRDAGPAPMAACGSESCAGCYPVDGPDGTPRRIHPPKASVDWEEWLRSWEPKGGRRQ